MGGVKGCSRSEPGLDWGVLVVVLDAFTDMPHEDPEEEPVDEDDNGPVLEVVDFPFALEPPSPL